MTSLTDTRKADIDLEEYQNILVAEGQAMAEKFKNNYIAFMKEQQSGNLAPIKEKSNKSYFKRNKKQFRLLNSKYNKNFK